MESRVERRLAAILCVDVVGYSRLIELDEAGALRALRHLRPALHPVIEPGGGGQAALAPCRGPQDPRGRAGGRSHVAGEEPFEARGRGVGDRLQPQPPEPAATALAPAALARLGTADQRLVGLDPGGQRLALRPDHRLADLVQPAPGGLIAGKTHLPLQLHGRDAALGGGHQPDRQEPARQAGLGLLEDRPGQERMLLAAGSALLDQPLPVVVGRTVAAAGAAKALRPAPGVQMGPALGVAPEPRQERRQIPRQLVRHQWRPPCSCFVHPTAAAASVTYLSVVES